MSCDGGSEGRQLSKEKCFGFSAASGVWLRSCRLCTVSNNLEQTRPILSQLSRSCWPAADSLRMHWRPYKCWIFSFCYLPMLIFTTCRPTNPSPDSLATYTPKECWATNRTEYQWLFDVVISLASLTECGSCESAIAAALFSLWLGGGGEATLLQQTLSRPPQSESGCDNRWNERLCLHEEHGGNDS